MSQGLKKTLVKGTLILTIAGAITKLLGFYNRIFLSNTIGAREIGIFQLIFPVYLIIHCICCMGFEMGITKYVAEETAFGNKKNVIQYLKTSLLFSLFLSICCSVILYFQSDAIATVFLKQPECGKCLYLLSFALPFISVKDVILSYYYAVKKTEMPALSQLVEQCARVGTIWLLGTYFTTIDNDASLAAYGLIAGEILSTLLALMFLPNIKKQIKCIHSTKENALSRITVTKRLLSYSIPLTINRLLITFLSSIESILIPLSLTKILHNENQALEIYGVLTGMAMTFILFPSAITNSLAMVLLPTVSEAKAQKQNRIIQKCASLSLHYCFLLGILCTAIFLSFGKNLGIEVFHNELAGEFILILSWLCPFIYIGTTFTSILNGLGKTSTTFTNNVISMIVRILAIIIGIPLLNLKGYLLGLLISYVLLAVMSTWQVNQAASIQFHAQDSILVPSLMAVFSSTIALISSSVLFQVGVNNKLIVLAISISILCGIYCSGLYIIHLQQEKSTNFAPTN